MKKYKSGNIEVMVMDPSDKKTWWGIYDHLNRYNKDLKEEGWRIPSANEMTYLYDIFGLGISGIKSGEYWTSNVYTEGNSGEPTSCLVFVFSPFRSSGNRTDYMPCIIRGTMSIKLPVILVKDI
jgi:hypothetical protein